MQNGKQVILVVEDEDSLRQMVTTILQHNDFKVLSAENGERGLEIFNLHEGQIDLILSDVNCRGVSAIDGPRLLKAVLERNCSTPFMFMSGGLEGADQAELEKKSGHDILWKPFRFHRLIEVVKSALTSYATAP